MSEKGEQIHNENQLDTSTPLELYLACFFCGFTIKTNKKDTNNFPSVLKDRGDSLWRPNRLIDGTVCPCCSKKIPSCSICQSSIEINNTNNNNVKNNISNRSFNNLKDTDKNENEDDKKSFRYIWCVKCKHGGHVEHYLDWFNEFYVCPSFDCNCKCNSDEIEQ